MQISNVDNGNGIFHLFYYWYWLLNRKNNITYWFNQIHRVNVLHLTGQLKTRYNIYRENCWIVKPFVFTKSHLIYRNTVCIRVLSFNEIYAQTCHQRLQNAEPSSSVNPLKPLLYPFYSTSFPSFIFFSLSLSFSLYAQPLNLSEFLL